MKIVTKNYSLKNGKRSYLVYLTDHNNNSLECYDLVGEEDRINKLNYALQILAEAVSAGLIDEAEGTAKLDEFFVITVNIVLWQARTF